MINKIKKAMDENKLITFSHRRDGKYTTFRKVAPYSLGTTSKGNEALRGQQLGGSGNTLFPRNFALFLLKNITNLQITKETFVPKHSGATDNGLSNIISKSNSTAAKNSVKKMSKLSLKKPRKWGKKK